MKTRLLTVVKGALCAMALVASFVGASARSQEVVVYPPPDFIATTAPVYYEGHAAYWYGNRWYYRDGANWRFYHDEPGYLHDWRGRRAPARQFYGRGHYGGYRR